VVLRERMILGWLYKCNYVEERILGNNTYI